MWKFTPVLLKSSNRLFSAGTKLHTFCNSTANCEKMNMDKEPKLKIELNNPILPPFDNDQMKLVIENNLKSGAAMENALKLILEQKNEVRYLERKLIELESSFNSYKFYSVIALIILFRIQMG